MVTYGWLCVTIVNDLGVQVHFLSWRYNHSCRCYIPTHGGDYLSSCTHNLNCTLISDKNLGCDKNSYEFPLQTFVN